MGRRSIAKNSIAMRLQQNPLKNSVKFFMCGYVANCLTRFNYLHPKNPQYSPHTYVAPTFDTKTQFATPLSTVWLLRNKPHRSNK